jgi:hypothetical protein
MSQNEETKPEQAELTGTKALWKEVETALGNATETVRGRLKELYVERELSDRVSLLEKAFAKVREARKELQKMKPDVKNKDLEGKVVELWSTEAWDKKQKALEALAKLEKATEAAFEGKSFDELKKLV